MKTWYEIYRERMNDIYFDHINTYYAPFIGSIVEQILTNDFKNMLEFGCGAANITKAVAHYCKFANCQFTASDNDTDMLKLAAENLMTTKAHLWHDDILNSFVMEQTFDMAFSHGVLEHFDDFQIRDIINQCKDCSILSMHYVPSNRYLEPSRGDERLMSVDQWLQIYPFDDIVEFNEGKDLILVVR